MPGIPIDYVETIGMKCQRRSWLVCILFSLIARVGIAAADIAPIAHDERPTAGIQSSSAYFQNAFPVVEHVHVLRQGEGVHAQVIGNVSVIEQTDGLILVDAGGTPGAGRRVVDLVRHISSKPVKAIVITHWHGDHHFGLSEVLKAWPLAMVVCTEQTFSHMNKRGLPSAPDRTYDASQIKRFEATRHDLESGGKDPKTPDSQRGLYAQEAIEVQDYEKDFAGAYIRFATLDFSERISFPDSLAPLEVMYLGNANTDGDAIAWLPKQKVIMTGDIVVSPVPFGAGTYPTSWIGVLKKIGSFDFAVLIPGHGLPEFDKTYLLNLIAAIEDLQSQVKVLVAQNLSLDETIKKVDFTKGNKLLVASDPWLVEWMEGYWEPIVDCIFAEAKGTPITQGKGCRQ